MKNNLSEGSKSYHEEANIYEEFSIIEDTPGFIEKYLVNYIKDKIVLDVGCGTGKYLCKFNKLSKKYYGLDISKDQLNIAESKISDNINTTFICSAAETINLPSNYIDTIISTWVLGTILDQNRREKALSEMIRVLKPDGRIFLVENDIGGEFEIIRDRYPNVQKTKGYNEWIEKMGLYPIKKFDTFFKFRSINSAKIIFSSIWGNRVLDKIKSNKISHNVVIYSN